MNNRARRSPAVLLIAVLALVVAVGGSAAIAAPSAKPLTTKMVKKLVKKQVKKAAPTLSVAKADTATKATTADSAAKATSADALSTMSKLSFAGNVGQSSVVYNAGGFRLTATCDAGPTVRLVANTDTNNSVLTSYGTGSDTNDLDFDVADNATVSDETNSYDTRHLVLSAPNGTFVDVQYSASSGVLYDGAAACVVRGLATRG
jgi:hypothetical protein